MTANHKALYWLKNYECDNCSTGVVQIHQKKQKRGSTVITIISGCLDCGHQYGIQQASALKEYTRDDIVWA